MKVYEVAVTEYEVKDGGVIEDESEGVQLYRQVLENKPDIRKLVIVCNEFRLKRSYVKAGE